MKKQDAVKLFGTTLQELGEALGGRGKSAISQWPEVLDEDKKNMVIGAAVRRGIKIPEEFLRQ
jgi:UTP--glucose-1-phosphate uridylyltransferase